MVLGMNCFGAREAARKVSPASKRLGGEGAETMEQNAVVKKEETPSGRVVGEAKQMGGGDRVKAAGKEEKKRSGAPIVMHHFPFHSRPGLL